MDRFSVATLIFNFTGLAVIRLVARLMVLGSIPKTVAVTLVSS